MLSKPFSLARTQAQTALLAVLLTIVIGLTAFGQTELNGSTVAKNTSVNNVVARSAADELAKTVELLEQRIRQLEARLARLDDPVKPASDTAKASEVAEIKKEIAAIQDDAKKNDGLKKFFRDVEVSGIVDGYYSFNNNKADMFTQGRAFDVRHNSFSFCPRLWRPKFSIVLPTAAPQIMSSSARCLGGSCAAPQTSPYRRQICMAFC